MFGYVAPDKNELKVRELTQYKAYYCGLCRTLGEHYGEASRIFLNYDCAFAAILLSGLFGEGDLCVPPHRPVAADADAADDEPFHRFRQTENEGYPRA